MSTQLINFNLFTHWASALVNGDLTGLDDYDERDLDAFIQRELSGYRWWSCVDVSEDSWFAHMNDASDLAGDVSTFDFVVGLPSPE